MAKKKSFEDALAEELQAIDPKATPKQIKDWQKTSIGKAVMKAYKATL